MQKKSPKEKIIELAGGEVSGKWSENCRDYKAKVLDQIIPYLDKREDEDDSDLKERLLGSDNRGSISNNKLLKLHRNAMRLKNEFGGERSKIIDDLLDARKGESGKLDNDYRNHLEKKTTATLMLLHDHASKAGEIAS